MTATPGTSGTRYGPFRVAYRDAQIEFLAVFRVDERGRCERSVHFDLEDLDAAVAELDRLHADAEQ